MPELKRCPFCGGEGHTKYYAILDDFSVLCEVCEGTIGLRGTQEEAINAWNTRVGEK